jgi:hypothetical protein
MASLNHNFRLSERELFLRSALDSSGKTGGGFFVLPVGLKRPAYARAKREVVRIAGPRSMLPDPRF